VLSKVMFCHVTRLFLAGSSGGVVCPPVGGRVGELFHTSGGGSVVYGP